MTKFIAGTPSDVLSKALYASGAVKERPEDVARIIIDLRAGSAAMIYIQTYADTDTLDVFLEGGLKMLVEEGEAAA